MNFALYFVSVEIFKFWNKWMLLKSLLLIGGIPLIRLCHRKKRVAK